MTTDSRWRSAALGFLALVALGLFVAHGASAEDAPRAVNSAGGWVYDVRVVRVDAEKASTLDAAPAWQPAGTAGSVTGATWADLLSGLKARGGTTILLDQRLTAVSQIPTEFRQERRRAVVQLSNRTASPPSTSETWSTSYIDTGVKGDLVLAVDGLHYTFDVKWDGTQTGAEAPAFEVASWKGSRSNIAAGETLVLSHRQQKPPGSPAPQGLEIYAFITAWPIPAK